MTSPLEFFTNQVNSQNSTEVGFARFAHYAITALINEEISINSFGLLTAEHVDKTLILDDPSGHVARTAFTLGSLSMELGSGMGPARVFIGGIGETNRQFTFRLDPSGQPAYQVLAPFACI